MPKDDLIRMRHMLDAARKAISFAEGRSRDDLDNEPMFAFALMRAIEVLGEAASRVSRHWQDRFDEIPWAPIVGMRNRLIHGYDDISLDILWHTVTSNLPPLIQTLESIIDRESRE